MKSVLAVILAAGVLALSGCSVAVPKTSISGSLAGKPFKASFPKDCALAGLTLTAETNGSIALKIDTLSSKNSADAIGASGTAYAAQVKALGEAFKAGWEAAGAAAGAAASKIVK